MTRHAKASSAGSNSGLRAKTPALLFLIALLTLVVGVSVAIAAKKVDSFAGSPTGATGNTAGLLNTPRGIAVNQAGTGGATAGDFYVVDGSNNRIVQYRANNTFVRAFGQDVVSSGPDQAIEVQQVTVNANEGTFKLTFGANTTTDLPYNATAGEVQTALNALASVNSGGGSVTVSGGPGNAGGSTPYVVSFDGAPLKGTNVAQMTGANGATPLGGGTGTGANTASVLTANSGANGYEICDVLANPTDVCKAGTTTGALGGNLSEAQGIAIEQSTGNLFVTDQGHRRVQKYSATGAWLLAFGSDVVLAGGSGDNPTAPLLNEKQTVQLRDLFGLEPPPTTGTFTLTFEGQTTTPIAAKATPAAVDAALEALSTVGPGGVVVSGPNGPNWSVEFTGPLGSINVPPLIGNPLIGNPSGLKGLSPEVAVSTNQEGGPGAPVLGEVCSLRWQCKAAGPAAAEAGAFGTSIGHPAVDSSGNVYIPDTSNRRVQKFSSAGTFLTAWGWDVIPAGRPGDTGSGLESCPAAAASTIGNCKAGAAGEGLGQFDSGRPNRMAVDSTGRVFALSDTRGVQTFDSSGGSPAKFAPADIPASPTATNIAIGAGDRVFVTQTCSAALCPDAAVANEQRIREFSSVGVLQDTHMVGAGFTTVNGLAVSTSGNLLVSTSGGTPGSRVWTLDDNGAQPASVAVINPPTEVTEHTASLNGSVTPNGPTSFTTSYRFEYSRNGVTWTPVAAEVNLGEGLSPVSVPTAPAQGAVSGLEANTFYRARIVAKKAFGAGTTISPEVTFLTDGVRPEVTTKHPQFHTDTSANLLGQLNPNNLPTTYHFEYGKTTAYGNSAPVPGASANGGVANLVSQQVEGLEPGTTYHYRLVATNSEGTTNGNDVTFKTYPADSVGLAQRAYEMMTPPFKTVRSAVAFGGAVGNNANPGVPSLSGDAMRWATAIFPLTEDVKGPSGGDFRYLERGAGGWSFTTQNTLSTKSHVADDVRPSPIPFSQFKPSASSGDLKTNSVQMSGGELIASDGYDPNPYYTYRAGTGVEGGYTPWLTNTDTQLQPAENQSAGEWGPVSDDSLLNDDGTALLRWGSYRGLAEDPGTLGDDDPSDEQLRRVGQGGPLTRSVYLQRAADPDALPAASKDLVNECTGSGVGATEIPNRVGTGSASTDTIGTQPCEPATGTPAASGTAVRSTGSSTLTGVTTDTGAFSVGQFVSGTGIPYGATITAVGAGTLTLSTPVLCGGAKGSGAKITSGSPEVTTVRPLCGKFEVGQTVTGAGIPGGTTIVDIDRYTLTLSAAATASGTFQNIASDTPSTTAIVANPQHVTSRNGARAGGFASIGALSNDGNRVFFMSPDFEEETGGEGGEGPAPGCATGTGVGTSCSPQLFVRQYDSAGNPTVRWISRAQGVGAQRVAEMGRGALFQGASRDGRYVYFHTDAPLLPNDPNAGVSITTGSAQANSWDLYRYTLPASRDVDPGGGTLLRVSGGPTGTADPDVTTVPKAASLRYFSDDGKRAYFLTTATIPDALNTPPGGGSTAPSGAVGNNATRNLYLFDDTGASPQWRFIAQLPYSISISNEKKETLNTCATARSLLSGGHIFTSTGNSRRQGQSTCFRGTRDGSGVVFFTRGQLTNDDRDDAGDIYLYDAEADELTRVSAPRNNTTPYICNRAQSVAGVETGVCNADLGINQAGGFLKPAGLLDNARGWGGARLYNVAKDANGKISVYFESQSQLIPEDTNGTRMDVYEWRAGQLSLVSPGNIDSHSFYSGNSIDGRDVFLFTSARLDPREIDDDDFDLYDVRRGGGFPYTPPAIPCEVLAHECRQPVAAPPAAPAPASQSLNGQGNQPKQTKQSCAKGKKLRQGKCVVKKSKAHKKHRKGATQRGSK